MNTPSNNMAKLMQTLVLKILDETIWQQGFTFLTKNYGASSRTHLLKKYFKY